VLMRNTSLPYINRRYCSTLNLSKTGLMPNLFGSAQCRFAKGACLHALQHAGMVFPSASATA